MRKPVTIDEFLELEEEARRIAKLRAPAREVRRFHAAVRRFAGAWCATPGRRVTASDTDRGVFLYHEIEDPRNGWIAVFSLRADHPAGEFYLKGPNAERKRTKMAVKLRKAMDQLYKAWKDLPGAEGSSSVAVTVHLSKWADSYFDRFLDVALAELKEF